MIREERDPAFWALIASDPAVAPHLHCADPVRAVSDLSQASNVLPIASLGGGFLFVQLDRLGRIFELHTLFLPKAWGREVASAAREAFALIFDRGARLVVTQEVTGWWRSAPPRSHGWKPVGDFEPHGALPPMRSWVLTSDAWSTSPVGKKVKPCL